MCGQLHVNTFRVDCQPAPDAFNPCEDVMGNVALRGIVWLVVVAAVIGVAIDKRIVLSESIL